MLSFYMHIRHYDLLLSHSPETYPLITLSYACYIVLLPPLPYVNHPSHSLALDLMALLFLLVNKFLMVLSEHMS